MATKIFKNFDMRNRVKNMATKIFKNFDMRNRVKYSYMATKTCKNYIILAWNISENVNCLIFILIMPGC